MLITVEIKVVVLIIFKFVKGVTAFITRTKYLFYRNVIIIHFNLLGCSLHIIIYLIYVLLFVVIKSLRKGDLSSFVKIDFL